MSTPAELYRNAIDLNRFSNSVAKRITRTYNNSIKEALERLAGLDAEPSATKSARLRAILANLKGSLDGWAGTSTALSVKELQELVELQAGFVSQILEGEIPENLKFQVRNVQISPQFAEAVATIDPTTYNVVTLSDDLGAAVTGTPKPFELDLGGGSTITLPNGAGLSTSFKRLAGKQAEIFTKEVQNGLILGESSTKIAARLRRQLTDVPGNQIKTMVRTSVNQIANAASQAVYSQNQDITTKYKYVSTLDSRTSALCRALDGREFKYGQGPTPPQHFNCRSTTVPVIDYERLGFTPPKEGKRAAEGGMVAANQSYGKWLKEQPQAVKEKVLGDKGQVGYFNALSKKYGPDGAIRRFVREDGSEKTIDDLKRAYGPVSKIKAKPKPKATIAKQKAEVQKSIAKAEKKVAVTGLADQIAAKEKEFKKLNQEVLKAFDSPKDFKVAADKATKAKAELEELRLKDPAYVAKQKAAEKALKKSIQEEADKVDLTPALAKARPPREALKRYTGETYREMRAEEFRQAKKAGKKLSAFEEAQIKIHKKNGLLADEAAEIESFLKRAPKHKGEVYRTMITDQEGLEGMLAGFKSGKQTLAMESWTSDSTLEFAQGRGQRVMLRTQNKKGVDISQLSEFEKESEVLMPKGVKYRLKSVTKEEISARATKEGRFSWIVDLEQL